ncbi:MAG: hypothetical protein R8M45_03470 [Ghiorsea sp.]
MDISAKGDFEARYFPTSVEYSNQKDVSFVPSGSFQPELVYEWSSGDDRLTLTPFFRYDPEDSRRTHADIREASWQHFGSNWDITLGMSKVFWGVTESVHLVDIINQTDAVESINGDSKLGQPMLNYNVEQSWGMVSLFALPGFRQRTFTADSARLHGPFIVAMDHPTFESSDQEKHVDWAARWSQNFDDLDVAVSYFKGTSREPMLHLKSVGTLPTFSPYYAQISQTGLELQLTTDNTIWKSETIHRTGQGAAFIAATAGFEHTLYAIAGSSWDMGLLLEYLYDDRDPTKAPPALGNHDVFAGFRLVMNDAQDTAILCGAIVDDQSGATLVNIEAERRLNNYLKLEFAASALTHIPDNDFLAAIRHDDFVELKLSWFY